MTRGRLSRLVWPVVILALAACDSSKHELVLAVSVEEPAPAVGETVKSTLEAGNFALSIETAPDLAEVITGVQDRTIDLAIIEEPDRPIPGIVTLAPLYPSVLHILHKRGDAIEDFDALIRDAKIYAGPPGGAAQQLLAQLASDFGVTESDYVLLDNPWAIVPDVYFVFGGLLSPDSTAQLSDYTLFSFASEGDYPGATVADGIALRHHHLQPFVLPKSIYGHFSDRAVLTLSIRSVLIASAAMDSELAHDIAYALFMNAQEISQPYPLVTRELKTDFSATNLMIPLHQGTQRFLNRDGPSFVERNAEVIALYFTFALTALSGLVALYRHRLQIRKDRVDEYMVKLLTIRTAMQENDSNVGDCRERVVSVQSEVINLLVDERITADASLLSFLMQSNQLLGELDRRAPR